MEPLYWIILLIILVVIEFATMGLTTIWFAGGALVACLISFLSGNLMLQIAIFLIVSLILLILTRPIAVKYLTKTRTKTNYETLIGKEVKVTIEINNGNDTGQVVVNGIEWTARADEQHDVYLEGDMVTVKEVSGVKLIVGKGEIVE